LTVHTEFREASVKRIFEMLRRLSVLACAVSGVTAAAGAPLAIKFKNSSGMPDNQVYIGFVGGEPLQATNAANGSALSESTFASPHWYTLADLPQGINLTSCSGRIYVGFGTPWVFERDGYEPNPSYPIDPNYLRRYDKIELSYHAQPGDVIDITAMDYFSIRTGIKVFKNGLSGTLVKSLNDAAATTVVNAVKNLTTPAGAAVVNDGSTFVRVLGPGVYPAPGGNPASPYPTPAAYLAYLHTYGQSHGNKIATISGSFIGAGAKDTPLTKPQTYTFDATMDAGMNITLSGSGSEAGSYTLEFKHADLIIPTGVWGANAPVSINSGAPATPPNDLLGWVVGDVLSGLNIGALGSTTVVNGTAVGQMPSQQWFGLTGLFNVLQPTQPTYYNGWARAIASVSDAYGFAFSDRFQHVFATLNPALVDTLQIEIGGEVSTCPADTNRDEVVDDADFVQFLASYTLLACDDPEMEPGCPGDLSGDGVVDDADFVQFVAAYNALVCP